MATHENDEGHPKAELLVYGFGAVSLLSSLCVGGGAFWLSQSKLFASLATLAMLRMYFGVAGGVKGINRAVGDGTLSLTRPPLPQNKPPGKVRLCFISDTHNSTPVLPEADILVHCGDFTLAGTAKELNSFCDWLESQPHPHKVVVCGNHDFCLENKHNNPENILVRQRLCGIATVLENQGAEVCGLQFWGAPQTPNIPRRKPMAFQGESATLDPYWKQIPSGLDVLVTHGPPKGYGDRILLGMQVGCPLLHQHIASLSVPPKLHAFGHIHEGYGIYPSISTLYINCAISNTLYQPIHPPIVLDL
ncbi:hypothetical protein BASA81_006496 [Batrachochytrium salamandrivorans]|nr:hypothetical protein BASA81_006496 [Batrachochytrium salamandrivorans]